MSSFACPVCGKRLDGDKTLKCIEGHSFDISKNGYVNLLLKNQSKNKSHGDDKLMSESRRNFLNKGYYAPLLSALCDICNDYTKSDMTILDAGCGECYYTAGIYNVLEYRNIKMIGIDISKEALILGFKRCKKIELAVASVYSLPIEDSSCNLLLSVFSPYSEVEFKRVLKPNGKIINVYPLEHHLWSLKSAVYENPYENKPENNGNKICEVRNMIHLDSKEDIQNLFAMTPYSHKTGVVDCNRLNNLSTLDVETEFGIEII